MRFFKVNGTVVTLLSGIQLLFADAKTIFYNWWRKPKPDKPPIIGDLFAQNRILGPIS